MSETSSLTELAQFVGSSRLNAEDPQVRQRAVSSIAACLGAEAAAAQRHRSCWGWCWSCPARTRRVVLPRVEIDVDVFAPDGTRAVRLILPRS